jgi:alkyl hydroperoxide reductase subunit AhpF
MPYFYYARHGLPKNTAENLINYTFNEMKKKKAVKVKSNCLDSYSNIQITKGKIHKKKHASVSTIVSIRPVGLPGKDSFFFFF